MPRFYQAAPPQKKTIQVTNANGITEGGWKAGLVSGPMAREAGDGPKAKLKFKAKRPNRENAGLP